MIDRISVEKGKEVRSVVYYAVKQYNQTRFDLSEQEAFEMCRKLIDALGLSQGEIIGKATNLLEKENEQLRKENRQIDELRIENIQLKAEKEQQKKNINPYFSEQLQGRI